MSAHAQIALKIRNHLNYATSFDKLLTWRASGGALWNMRELDVVDWGGEPALNCAHIDATSFKFTLYCDSCWERM